MVDISIKANFSFASVSTTPQLYRVKHDVELPAGIWRAGLPEVFALNDEKTPFKSDCQLLSYDMNVPNLTGDKWRSVYQYNRAFNNNTGFNDPNDPRADYVNVRDLTFPLPRWDKTRVCGGATITGVEDGMDLIVDVLDGFGPAPTKEWMDTHPTFQFYAVNSTLAGITNFPQGGGMPVKIPLVGSGVARIPLTNLQKVPDIADPYFIGYRPKPIIAPAITHELVNLTSTVAHLYRIDLSRVVPFVTPFTGYKLTPSQFLDLYGMDFAINGDGGSWLFGLMQMLGLNRFDLLGSLVSAGRWMSNGKWISQVTSENSIWFESSGRCNIAYSKPVGLSPWNVISGPKQMINNSLQVRLYDDTFVAARSAFGVWNDNTHAVAIAIEGNEFTDFGATEQELAEFGVSLDLFQMMELDSGGSTSVAFKSGISYSVENRPVLNALCFKSRV